MITSEKGLAAIRKAEGLSLKAYPDGDGFSIGYGHHTKDVKKDDTCTLAQAEEWLKEDSSGTAQFVQDHVKVALNQNQFDALVSFAYNVGETAFGNSTLLRLLNEGDYGNAANQFSRWVYSKGVVDEDLVARRQQEKTLFLTPLQGQEDAAAKPNVHAGPSIDPIEKLVAALEAALDVLKR